MSVVLVILVLTVLSYGQVYSEDICSDCMSFKSCPGASYIAKYRPSEIKNQLFLASFCGFIFDGEKITDIVKVCCSMFPKPDPIEAHPNRELLPESCGDIYDRKILGGTTAELYEFPWMTLISIRTTAHCVVNRNIAGVRIGEHNLHENIDCSGDYPTRSCEFKLQDIGVEEVLHHEDFQGFKNNIALLRLKKNINLTLKNARPICLPVTVDLRQLNITGQYATVAGWDLSETGHESQIPRIFNLPILSRSECAHGYHHSKVASYEMISNGSYKIVQAVDVTSVTCLYNIYYNDFCKYSNQTDETDKVICGGAPSKDVCGGDPGSPLMLQTVYNGVLRNVQYGIVSHGPRLCGSTQPGFYTDVTKFMRWILDNLKH